MTKFFFIMSKKRTTLYHSQIIGIIWISIILLTILSIKLFSSDRPSSETKNDSITAKNIEILKEKEDSVYRQRRGFKGKKFIPSPTLPQREDGEMTTWTSPVRRQPLTVELNSADTTTLMLLHGIGPAYARRIVRYRERLGGFTRTDQLLEVYGFTPELLVHISPHLSLDTAYLHRININTVELKQLIKHPYVEYYFARDLVNLRSRGITFSSPDDLRAIPSCTDSMLNRILPYLNFSPL